MSVGNVGGGQRRRMAIGVLAGVAGLMVAMVGVAAVIDESRPDEEAVATDQPLQPLAGSADSTSTQPRAAADVEPQPTSGPATTSAPATTAATTPSTSASTAAPTETTSPPATASTTTSPPTTSPPTTPPPTTTSTSITSTSAAAQCHPNYSPCLPFFPGDALNCGDLSPSQKPVTVPNPSQDPYGLDADNDGVGCESG